MSVHMFECSRCGQPVERAALVFSPPDESENDLVAKVDKLHICCSCWEDLLLWLSEDGVVKRKPVKDKELVEAFHHLWTKAGSKHHEKKEWKGLANLLRKRGIEVQ